MIVGDNFFLLLLFCVFQNFNNKHKFSNNCFKKKKKNSAHVALFLIVRENDALSTGGGGEGPADSAGNRHPAVRDEHSKQR